MKMEIIPVLHNVSSVQRLVDSVKTAYSLGAKTFVVTKAYGGAAQSGVAEAMRISLKLNKQFIVLPDLDDVVELLHPDRILLLTYDYSKDTIDLENMKELNGRILVVVSGSDPEFSSSELKLGEPVYFKDSPGKIGPIGELALILYTLARNGVSR